MAEVPAPAVTSGRVLVRTANSLISAGTERMLADFGKASWVEKARQQPDKVRMVLDKARTDGIASTLEAVKAKLDQPLALGYCNVGQIEELGEEIGDFSVGDRVASNGNHAELVSVPTNLCARVPDNVTDEQAAFTVLAAIGLQGIRLANPTLGECVAVTGLGLVGLLTVQMLKAQGCRVLGIDMDPKRLALAKQFGAEVVNANAGDDVLAAADKISRGRGMDAVIIAASTKSNEPMHQAAAMCRKRGRIVLVGVTGLKLSRADFFDKELTFQVSCSYGPGRYDPSYEEGGQDYPIGYVRWTEQRNFEAALDLMASGAIDTTPLISHRFALDEAEQAYALLSSDEPHLGIMLQYPHARKKALKSGKSRVVELKPPEVSTGKGVLTFLGAGNYAGRVLMPAFKAAGAQMHAVVSSGGTSAAHYGKKYGFALASTDEKAVLKDRASDTVVIATRHNLHANQVLSAFRTGKHVFCEKPLCLTIDDLQVIEKEAVKRAEQVLMIGFNRRFAPLTVRAKSLLDGVAGPRAFVLTVNAGEVPADHWTQDPTVGGGRVIGEACHFVDLLRHLAGAPITSWDARAMGDVQGQSKTTDIATINLAFGNGSIGTIHYFANGHKSFPKERLEIFTGGRVLQLDNFRSLRGWGWSGFSGSRSLKQDKGQTACVKAFMDAVRTGGEPPIPLEEILEVSRVTIEAAGAMRK